MTHAHQIADAAHVRKFLLAGNARFTLVSKATGTRFTFKIRVKFDENSVEDKPSIYFVSLLNGPDNEGDYAYLGHIWPDRGIYQHGRKSKIGADAPSARAFDFFWRYLQLHANVHAGIEFWHEGQCGRCGRALTVPESIASGFGPECITKI